jgi:hypothetical protein
MNVQLPTAVVRVNDVFDPNVVKQVPAFGTSVKLVPNVWAPVTTTEVPAGLVLVNVTVCPALVVLMF